MSVGLWLLGVESVVGVSVTHINYIVESSLMLLWFGGGGWRVVYSTSPLMIGSHLPLLYGHTVSAAGGEMVSSCESISVMLSGKLIASRYVACYLSARDQFA